MTLVPLDLGGSPAGWHLYSEYLYGCARRAFETKNDVPRLSSKPELAIGTVYHGLQAQFRRPEGLPDNLASVEYSVPVSAGVRREAESLFRAYRADFPAAHLGEVLAIEQGVWGELGGRRVSARLDLVTKPPKSLAKRRGLPPLPTGVLITDFKTAGSGFFADRQRWEIQFLVQQELWLQHHGGRVAGTLVDIAVKAKPATFQTIYVPPITEGARTMLHEIFSRSPIGLNPTRCWDCPLFQVRCDRTMRSWK